MCILMQTYCPVIVSCEEESAEKAMRDKDGVTPTTSFLHVTVECLKECGDSVKHISSTEEEGQTISTKTNIISAS